ncbi:PREDICTED: putative FBD-associated F-box protein At1g05080 [Camelina sativa]|uniref:FBD-associated F-box protein At1g05080 n=1 Tax=Camelina sativa TaxID=90675 RepID=A0ABM1QLD2_CAMSA|nr:PREDICTED: putative FBD-associated F-box protein At1g05080 [Camelina sativa]
MLETTKSCGGGRIEERVGEDMISALPEDLLVNILKYVPTKDAVATMILSKRWRFTWTMLPKLDYKENKDDESKRSVWWFLEKSLQLLKAPVLTLLLIELGPRCPSDADVGKCVAKAVDRRVVVLALELRWSADPARLPNSLYSCKTLEVLNLSHKILVDVPCTACLPSLTMLWLDCVVYKNDESLIRLLSGCSVLESMYVKRIKDDNVKRFTVKVPSLLELEYVNHCNDVEEDTCRCLVIDTPALTEFDITYYSGDSCSIENTPCLEQVYIDIERCFPDVDNFLRSFSAVSFLELDLTDEMILCCTTIKFSRLTMCRIRPWDSDWMDSLVPFLENTPKLKCFIVDYRSTHKPPIASPLWNETGSDPKCLSSSLEKFELIDYTGREEEVELVEYILTTSKILETATISMRSLPDLKMMKELKAIPRMKMKMRYSEIRKRDKGVPVGCNCGVVLLVARSNDPSTRGELYFSCAYEITNGPVQGCGFRRWWNDALRDEFVNITEEKNEMKQDLDAAKKRIETQEEIILNMERNMTR